jgi:predicted Zn-dependent protease
MYEQTNQAIEEARRELRRAYLLVSFGDFDQALHICRDLTEKLPEHPLPAAMEGAFLTASGKPQSALKLLSRVIRRFPESALARLYFCEACLLSGRLPRGLKELEKLDPNLLDTPELKEFAASLKDTFDGLDPAAIPAPVIVAEPDDAHHQG